MNQALKLSLSLFLYIIFASSSFAQTKPTCSKGNANLFILDDWVVEKEDDFYSQVRFTISNNLENPAALTEGMIEFYDVLGKNLTNFEFPRNKLISPKEIINEVQKYNTHTLRRLTGVNPSLITTVICINAIVTADGEVVNYLTP